jgi:hypothetical protein
MYGWGMGVGEMKTTIADRLGGYAAAGMEKISAVRERREIKGGSKN